MSENQHADLLELAIPYALDALADTEREEVEQRLSRADEPVAADFRATVRDIREAMASMTVVDARPAPPELEAALQRALDRQIAESGTGATQAIPLRRRRAVTLRWIAAAAVVVAIALGTTIAVHRSGSTDSGAVTASQVLTHSDTRAATEELTGGGTVTVNASRELDAATVSFAAVPAAPADHTYQLWLLPEGGQPKSAGIVTSLPTDRAPMLMRLDHAQGIALSVEPAGGSDQPTTTPLVAVTVQ
ncbi:anti-sigma factor [Nocardia sp. NBC_01327]|uniref:anti-sigma factor n=1 Tax=Nocardia sp. NBC_01327 TaxID=2903593 RepID=UPI002E1530B2|nr:anti-sigma factor [Nocardia sp. NBC_01327]